MGSIIRKFKKLGPKIFVMKLLGFEPVFTCAIRKKGVFPLYGGNLTAPFTAMPDSKEYWFADPLLYEYEGKTVLFMEAVNYYTQRGKIVYSEIVDNHFTEIQTALEEDFHMSFPNIFRFGDELYMIPEAEASGGIVLFKCLHFPERWEMAARIKTDVPVVDSAIECIEGSVLHMISSTYDKDPLVTKYFYYQLDFSDPENIQYRPCDEVNQQMASSYEYRNGGRFSKRPNQELLHCVQTSTSAIYGYSLKFFPGKLENYIWKDDFSRTLEITPDRIKVDNLKHKVAGLHTYSETDSYEVIDAEYFEWRFANWTLQLRRLLGKI